MGDRQVGGRGKMYCMRRPEARASNGGFGSASVNVFALRFFGVEAFLLGCLEDCRFLV